MAKIKITNNTNQKPEPETKTVLSVKKARLISKTKPKKEAAADRDKKQKSAAETKSKLGEQVAKKKVTKKKVKKVVKKVARKAVKKPPKKAVKKSTPKTRTTSPLKKNSGGQTTPKNEKKSLPRAALGSEGGTKRKHHAEGKSKRQPLGHLLVEKLLREAGFAGGVSSHKDILERYSTDESIFAIKPQIVLQPKNQRDVEIAVTVLGEQTHKFPALSLTPRAAGTGLSGGSLTDSVVIDVCKYMHHIEEPVKSRGVNKIIVEPGAMWKDVEKILKKHGVYLPPYPASKDICSIGGSIANNAAGPDSLRYGHCADWVDSMNVTLYDGITYTLKPITYREYKTLIRKDNALARILEEVFTIIEKNESTIEHAKPKTQKNSAGYALWHVIDGSVASFKRGKAKLDLGRLVSGSQGTIGVITSLTLKTEPICQDTELIVVPVFDLMDAGKVIQKALDYDPINVEIFDGLTFDLAMKNPSFFKDRLSPASYYRVLLSMYTLYHVRYGRKIPEFHLLITLNKKAIGNRKIDNIVKAIRDNHGRRARHIKNSTETEMFWQIRRASYTLSKFQDANKRPAAFLEDMTVPTENISKFLVQIKKLLRKYHVTAAVHGHGGNGHFHFYPLLDFTQKTTADLVTRMSEEFFETAVKFDGCICGEHNDGIIRTPHLDKMFNKTTIHLFEQVEQIFDPADIFNPGKKVNPKFDVKENLRKTN